MAILRRAGFRNALLPSSIKLARRFLLTRSTYQGPSEPPLLHQTTGSHLAEIASQYGDSLAVVSRHQSTRLTYDELHSRSTALAHGLAEHGVQKGDRVAVSLGNTIENALLTYACFKLGAILVPLNPSFNAAQVTSALNHLATSHLIISLETNFPRKPPRSNIPLLRHFLPDLKVDHSVVPSLKHVITVDNSYGRVDNSSLTRLTRYEDVAASGEGKGSIKVELDPDEVCNIQFTSGTTSVPKAAMLSHKSILNNGKQIGDRLKLTSRDIICCPPPLFHCFGCILGYMASATHGSTLVFPYECFDPKATLQAVAEEKCTALYGVPTMFIAELELLENGIVPHKGFEHLRTGIGAGTNIPAELMRKLHKKLNLTELTICYGQTETSPVSAMTTTDDPIEKRVETVGRLLPHVEAKIVSPYDPNEILPIGQKGELAVSGYSLMKGYFNDPEKTLDALKTDADGKVWMHSGDEAEMDAQGYIKITGRIKDLIIRGGENIHPLEIENCLLSHPAILDASVVGLSDARYGEVVAAFVIRKHHGGGEITKEEVRSWVRDNLSGHLVPKFVFWVEDFPKTPSGKVQKFKLRDEGMRLRDEELEGEKEMVKQAEKVLV